jgi:AbrB family looped-hinge helix DNA binding protein
MPSDTKECTVKVDRIGRVVIPSPIREIMDIEEGDFVTLKVMEVHKK